MRRIATAFIAPLMAGLMASADAEAGTLHVRVVDPEGRGVAGIAVEVRRADEPPRTIAADADGWLTIPGDRDGGWTILLARRGEAELAWCDLSMPFPARAAGTKDAPIVMTLVPMDWVIRGSVVDGDGRPIAGARVVVYDLAHLANGWIWFRTGPEAPVAPGLSDAAGQFAIRVPRDTGGGLVVRHPRYVGPRFTYDFRTLTQPPEALVLDPAGGIVGRVIDAATGRPVAGAVLEIRPLESHYPVRIGPLEALSDAQGRFRAVGVDTGVYNVELRRVPGRPEATAPAVEGVRVRAGADATADLAVVEGRTLRGVVVDRITGEPAPGEKVSCFGPARPLSGRDAELVSTDDRGRFAFHVPPGENVVSLYGIGQAGRLTHRRVIVPERGEIEPIRLVKSKPPEIQHMAPVAPAPAAEVKAAPPGAPIRVAGMLVDPVSKKPILFRGAQARAAAKPAGRLVTGRVRDPQGRPVLGVEVGMSGLTVLPSRFTDREGTFELPDVPRRPVDLYLSPSRGRMSQREIIPADRDHVEITLQPEAHPVPEEAPPAPARDEPIPPGLRDRLTFVDLDPRGTDYLADGPDRGGNDLNRVPRGVHRLGETYFRVGERMVHLRGGSRADLPQSAKGIAVGARCRVLHFLHATQARTEPNTIIGSYVVHYADGSRRAIPIRYGREITSWLLHRAFPDPTAAKVAWVGTNELTDQIKGSRIRLYDMSWTNPHPEKEIASLDALSAGKSCDPFLVAVTLDRGE